MQRSRTTSTPRSGRFSTARTSSRSSMTVVSTPRLSSSWSKSFSSTRTRDSRTPTRGAGGGPPRLFTPVLCSLRGERERQRDGLLDLELRTAVGTRHDLALHGVGADVHVGIALGTLRHGFLPPSLATLALLAASAGLEKRNRSEPHSARGRSPARQLCPRGLLPHPAAVPPRPP